MDSIHRKAIKSIQISMAGNLVLALAKGVAGYFGHSFALVADGIESTSDVLSSLLLLLALRYASRPADENHPYGHGRAEPLITFVIVGFLVVSAAIIIVQSIRNITIPHQAPAPYTLFVLGTVVLIKEVFYRFINQKSKEISSSALRADAWHHRSDAITSLAAFIGISVALIFGEGYEMADDYAALLASGFILYNSYLVFRPALGEIMDEHQYDDLILSIKNTSKTVTGILEIEKCLVRKTGMTYYIDLHAVVDGQISVREGHALAHRLKDKLKQDFPQIADVLIHIEPDNVLHKRSFSSH